jgi:hypothetical protein
MTLAIGDDFFAETTFATGTSMPNRSAAANVVHIDLQPGAKYLVWGNVAFIPVPGKGQVVTVSEYHVATGEISATIDPFPAGGASEGSHALVPNSQGGIRVPGGRIYDFKTAKAPTRVYLNAVCTWSWTGGGSQPPVTAYGRINSLVVQVAGAMATMPTT